MYIYHDCKQFCWWLPNYYANQCTKHYKLQRTLTVQAGNCLCKVMSTVSGSVHRKQQNGNSNFTSSCPFKDSVEASEGIDWGVLQSLMWSWRDSFTLFPIQFDWIMTTMDLGSLCSPPWHSQSLCPLHLALSFNVRSGCAIVATRQVTASWSGAQQYNFLRTRILIITCTTKAYSATTRVLLN